jgi:hypothetical protein
LLNQSRHGEADGSLEEFEVVVSRLMEGHIEMVRVRSDLKL